LGSPAGTILDVFVHNEVWDQLFAVRTPALAEQQNNKKYTYEPVLWIRIQDGKK
jgi:hypothetical protein